jgi:hypothetical protein
LWWRWNQVVDVEVVPGEVAVEDAARPELAAHQAAGLDLYFAF